jgi:hypothetical protein
VYPILALTCLASDHRIRQYGRSPVHPAETSLLHPNDSIHGSASSTADWIPDLLDSNYECSQNVRDWPWWTGDDVLQGFEGVLLSEPPDVLDDPRILYDNPLEYIDPCLLTKPEHESLIYSPSVIIQPALETSAQRTQSQSSLISTFPALQRPVSTTCTKAPSETQESDLEKFRDSSFSVPLYSSPSQSASPTRSDQNSSDTLGGKMQLIATRAKHVCRTCQESFTTERQYQNHIRALSCHTPFNCDDCGQTFKTARSLQRHRGHTKAASSCSKVKIVDTRFKPFGCTCSQAYTRKDSLQRHLRKDAGDAPRQHRCRTCNHARCRCP